MTHKFILAICLIASTGTPAMSQVGGPSNDAVTADILDASCYPPNGIDKDTRDIAGVVCETYFRGLTDGLYLMKRFSDSKKEGCLPTNSPLSTAEAKADFHLFLLAHPEAQKNSAGLVASFGIMQTHPCSAAK